MEVVGVIASCAAIANVLAKAYEFGDKMRDAQGLWEEYVTSLKMLEKVRQALPGLLRNLPEDKLQCLTVEEKPGQSKSLVDVCAKMMEDIAEEVMDFMKKYALNKSKVERVSQWFKRQFRGYLFVYNEADIRRRIENVHRVVDIFQLAVTMAAIALNNFGQSTTEQMLRDLSGKVCGQLANFEALRKQVRTRLRKERVRVRAAETPGSTVDEQRQRERRGQRQGERRRSLSQSSGRGLRSRDSVAQVEGWLADQASTPIEATHSDEARGTTRGCDAPDDTHQVVDQGLAMDEQSDSSTAELPAEIQTREGLVSTDDSEAGDSVEVEFPNGQVAVFTANAAFVDTYGSGASGSDDGAGPSERASVGGAPSNADMPLTDAQELVNYMAETDNASELSSSASETLGASSAPSIPILPEVDVLIPRNTAYKEVDDV